jgi:hypothetical protein
MAANFNENDQLQTGTILAQNEKGGENICVRAADVLPVNTEDSESVKDVVNRMMIVPGRVRSPGRRIGMRVAHEKTPVSVG